MCRKLIEYVWKEVRVNWQVRARARDGSVDGWAVGLEL